MASEFCPKCLSPQNVSASTSTREQVDSEGKKKKITTRSYHCEVCHSFVRSEEFEDTEEDLAGELSKSTLVATKR